VDLYKLFIGGEFVEAANKETFESIDPGNGYPIAVVSKAGQVDAVAAIEAARCAFDSGVWSGLTVQKRAQKLNALADQITKQASRLALIESKDSGQVFGFSNCWGPLGAQLLRNYANYAASKFPWEEEIPYSGNPFSPGRDFIRREPLGVCVGIIPWNFPLGMAFWKIGQALAMGNSIVLKPAMSTPLSALVLCEAVKAAGIPDGIVNIIPGAGDEIGETLCTHPAVEKISFTGSTEVGRRVIKMAADSIKKVTLELGGKSANIILDDADLDLAVEGAIYGTFFHQGQTCESGTRLLVSSKIYDQFLEKMKKRTESLRIGYQLDPNTQLGPIISASQLETIERYVKLGQEEGAALLTGGKRIQVLGLEEGFYYQPTIFTSVKNNMRIAQEEIFGPVVCIMKFDSDDEAVAIANNSIYGLAGGIFSRSNSRAVHLAKRIQTGTMWINTYHSFADFCPFGGYKQSGIGREMGHAGLLEYTQIKRVHVAAVADHKSNFSMKIFSDDPKIPFIKHWGATKILAGHGSLSSIYQEAACMGIKRALIVTNDGVCKAGLTQLVQDALGEFCVGVFEGVDQNSDLDTVDKAVAMAKSLDTDCIVSVGGGSVIDTAKVVCVTLKNGGSAKDHLVQMRLAEPQTPHICIPTTTGSGSEVMNMAIIKNRAVDRNVYLSDPFIVPQSAILDPVMTLTLPKELTAATAMDALAHAIEALSSSTSNVICDAYALQAIRLIYENLPKVMEFDQDESERLNLQLAATLAGWAVSCSQLGVVHSMAHALGMLCNLRHGTACGIVLPAVMRFNAEHASSKLAQVAWAMGINISNMHEKDAALVAADTVECLLKTIGHPQHLSQVGISKDLLTMASFHAIADTSTLFNARPVRGPQEINALYEQIF
jgi:acyl-CoA reductase-like NAD-dependent aldehyde dehydrogenase/alcohol dehydrogenase class IV